MWFLDINVLFSYFSQFFFIFLHFHWLTDWLLERAPCSALVDITSVVFSTSSTHLRICVFVLTPLFYLVPSLSGQDLGLLLCLSFQGSKIKWIHVQWHHLSFALSLQLQLKKQIQLTTDLDLKRSALKFQTGLGLKPAPWKLYFLLEVT